MLKLNNVIYSKDLAKNLLSLRKFVDQGLKIYLDNKYINIYDPISSKTILTGLYHKPFWEINLKIEDPSNNSVLSKNKMIFAYIATRSGKIVRRIENNEINSNNKLLKTTNNTRVQKIDDLNLENINGSIQLQVDKKPKLNTVLVWHGRLGHKSAHYMIKFKQLHPELKYFDDSDFDEGIHECEVCFKAKMNKLPFHKTRFRETRPLFKIDADVMGYISPVTYPNQYRFIVVFVDSFSRYAGIYPLKHKTEVPNCLREFIVSARLIGENVKIGYMCCDKGTEFTSKETIKVLSEFGAQLQTVCPGTPEHNGVVERLNQTIQKKVRALLFDSGLPANMWGLTLGVGTYLYNLSPHKTLGMKSPIELIAPIIIMMLTN